LSGNLDHIQVLRESKNKTFSTPSEGGIPWISTGMNYNILDAVSVLHGELRNGMNYKNDLQPYFDALEEKRKRWEVHALMAPTLYDYLRTKYYEGE
jgi:hypothetical protein